MPKRAVQATVAGTGAEPNNSESDRSEAGGGEIGGGVPVRRGAIPGGRGRVWAGEVTVEVPGGVVESRREQLVATAKFGGD